MLFQDDLCTVILLVYGASGFDESKGSFRLSWDVMRGETIANDEELRVNACSPALMSAHMVTANVARGFVRGHVLDEDLMTNMIKSVDLLARLVVSYWDQYRAGSLVVDRDRLAVREMATRQLELQQYLVSLSRKQKPFGLSKRDMMQSVCENLDGYEATSPFNALEGMASDLGIKVVEAADLEASGLTRLMRHRLAEASRSDQKRWRLAL